MLLIIAFIISTFFKVIEVKDYNFPFTIDQGRDMTDIRQMVVTHTPRLVGPTTSINGVLLGPFWYYFNLPPFLISHGNPQYLIYWQIVWYQGACLFLCWVLRKNKSNFGLLASVLLLLAPFGFNTARYVWNANSMPIFTILFFALFFWKIELAHKRDSFLMGLAAGAAMQIEAAFGILFFPFLVIYQLLKRRNGKILFWSFVGFGVTVIPQILFEIRHGFMMSKLLLSEFSGKGAMLGEKITFMARLQQRSEQLVDLVRQSNHLPENVVFIITAIALVTILWRFILKKGNKYLGATVFFVILTSIFYIVFPQQLKVWYTLGFSVIVVMVMALFLDLIRPLAWLFVILTIIFAGLAQRDYLGIMNRLSSNNPSNMQNEMAEVDWVYQQAQGRGFNEYTYLSSIYDYPYQHAFWWYGTQKYGYQPADIAYLPRQPEYIKDGVKAWTKQKAVGENDLTFLIINYQLLAPVWHPHVGPIVHCIPFPFAVSLTTA